MRIGVTGGIGCLGCPLVEKLIKGGSHLRLLVLPNDPSITYVDNAVETITGDLNSPEPLDPLCLDCDVVFHL